MIPRGFRLLMPVLCLIPIPTAGNAQSASQPIAHFDGGLATLNDKWAFHLGDDMRWASPAFDDSAWEKLTADKPWGAQGHANTEGFGWYRWHLHLPPGRDPQQLAILMPSVEDAYELYWNGRLVGTYGHLPPHPVWYYGLRPRTFSLGPAQDGVLAVRAWKSPFGSYDTGVQGGFHLPPKVGSPIAIDAALTKLDYSWLRGNQMTFSLESLYGLIAVLGLLLWLRDRSQWLGFWMGCFAGAHPLGTVLLGLGLPMSFVVAQGLNQPAYLLADFSLWFVLIWLLDLHDDPKLTRLARIFAAAVFAAGIADGLVLFGFALPNPVPWQIVDSALMPISMVLELFPFYVIGLAVYRRKKLDPSRWAVAVLAFISQTLFAVSVDLQQWSRFTHWTLSQTIRTPLFTVLGNRVGAYTISVMLLLLALVYAVYRYSAETRRQQAILEQEMRNAREVQKVLVPETIPSVPGFAIQSVYKPAGEVGGDFFQILPLSRGGVLAVIGDVSGKGMPAAMTVSLLVGTVRTLAHYTQSPGEILTAMNYRMLSRQQGGFTTCLVACAEPDGTVKMANAGHLAPILNGREVSIENGLPLGLSASTSYSELTIRLGGDQQLTLLTDGVVEARSKTGELFCFERTAAIADHSADWIAQTALDFGQDDDITVLTLKLRSATAAETVFVSAPELSPSPA
ncbi:MAG: SpoIIE family protein phosphatase [Terracidiphilus sp.]